MKRAWGQWRASDEPIVLPTLLSTSLPFRYPPELFHTQTHGVVTLRLHVDSLGRVVPESTQIAEHATHSAFDSAALEGASQLIFRPARRGSHRIPHTVLFPIRFRVPDTAPSPRDTTQGVP
jgi:TonB family protein